MSATSTVATIINAAVACFAENGMQITMDEIAGRAGVTRRTLYRAFPDRRALIEAVAISRLDHILAKVRPAIDAKQNFADALVSGFVHFVRHARADSVFIGAIEVASEWQLEKFLVGPHRAFAERAEALWRNTFERAKKSHEWKVDLDPSKVNAWLRCVAVVLLLRDDLNAKGQEELVRIFVVPAFMAAGSPTKRKRPSPGLRGRKHSR